MNTTYNPIGVPEEYSSSGFFAKIPVPSSGYAIILTGGHSKDLVISERSVPSRSDLRKGSYDKKIIIDIHKHMIAFDDLLASKDSAYQFRVRIVMNVQIDDPLWIYTNGIRDVAVALKTALRPDLHQMALKCQMSDWKQLQNDILMWLQGLRNNKRQQGEYLRVFTMSEIDVELTQDAKYVAHQEELLRKQAQADFAKHEHQEKIREMMEQEEYENLEYQKKIRDMLKNAEMEKKSREIGSIVAGLNTSVRDRYYAMASRNEITYAEAERLIREDQEREEKKRLDEEQRQRNLNSEMFDENLRRMNAGLDIVAKLDKYSSLSPDWGNDFLAKILGNIGNTQNPGLNAGTPMYQIEGNRSDSDDNPYAPNPEDDFGDDDEF